MEKKKVRSTLDFALRSEDKEKKSLLPKVVVPDESLTVRQIIERFTRGQGSGVAVRDGQYDDTANFDTPDMEKLEHMDLIERDEFAGVVDQRRKELEAELKAQADERKRKQKEQEDFDKELREDFKKRKEEGKKSKQDDGGPKG